jgi:hypothetical protein
VCVSARSLVARPSLRYRPKTATEVTAP